MAVPQHLLVVGCLVRDPADRVLLVRHPRRGWEIPQGKVEEGEDLVTAAHREVREETGIDIDLGPVAAVHSKVSSPPAIILTFLARYRGGEPCPGEDCLEAGWFPAEEAVALVSNPVNADRLQVLLAYRGKIVYRSYSPQPFRVHRDTFLD